MILVNPVLLFSLIIFGTVVTTRNARAQRRTLIESEALCERFGDTLERKFATNPQGLVRELDQLIMKLGTLDRDRLDHDKSGRMLASIAEPSRKAEVRRGELSKERSKLRLRSHNKLTEANRFITQTKRKDFFDEDEERAAGVQQACARVIFDRATILEQMTRGGR